MYVISENTYEEGYRNPRKLKRKGKKAVSQLAKTDDPLRLYTYPQYQLTEPDEILNTVSVHLPKRHYLSQLKDDFVPYPQSTGPSQNCEHNNSRNSIKSKRKGIGVRKKTPRYSSRNKSLPDDMMPRVHLFPNKCEREQRFVLYVENSRLERKLREIKYKSPQKSLMGLQRSIVKERHKKEIHYQQRQSYLRRLSRTLDHENEQLVDRLISRANYKQMRYVREGYFKVKLKHYRKAPSLFLPDIHI